MSNQIQVVFIGPQSGAGGNRITLEMLGLTKNRMVCSIFDDGMHSFTGRLKFLRYFLTFIRFLYIFLFKIKFKDIVIFYDFNLITPIEIIFARIKKCVIFFEMTEYPYRLIVRKQKMMAMISLWLTDRFSRKWLKYAKGIIICSKYLENYYKQFTSENAKFFKLPVIVNYDKFANSNRTTIFNFKYIAYCGYMDNDKDGVFDLIEAFKLIVPFYNINLVLIGSAEKVVMNVLRSKANKFEERIVFTGWVSHENIPSLLLGASVLVLSRPNNKQAEGGFPSKLGEYLATGKPTIVTKVGDIPDFVQDKVNGFLAEPDNVEKFAEKIKNVLDNYSFAMQVGKQGQKFIKQFDYKQQGFLLKKFLLD
jgi:glycosyltransferase involved in cell wall biosynthesis